MSDSELTDEQVRDLAHRWVEAYVEHDEDALGMDADELGAFLGWVSRRMAHWIDAGVARGLRKAGDEAVCSVLALHIAADLGIEHAWALCEAAGWPS